MAINLDFSNLRNANDKLGIEGGYFCYHLEDEGMYDLIDVIATYPERKELVSPSEWHCTVLYSKSTGRPWQEIDSPAFARIRHFECWVDHKGRDIIVCMLHFPKASLQHRNLSQNGWKHTFPEYNAHINMVKGTTHKDWAKEATEQFGGKILRFKDHLFSSPSGL